MLRFHRSLPQWRVYVCTSLQNGLLHLRATYIASGAVCSVIAAKWGTAPYIVIKMSRNEGRCSKAPASNTYILNLGALNPGRRIPEFFSPHTNKELRHFLSKGSDINPRKDFWTPGRSNSFQRLIFQAVYFKCDSFHGGLQTVFKSILRCCTWLITRSLKYHWNSLRTCKAKTEVYLAGF